MVYEFQRLYDSTALLNLTQQYTFRPFAELRSNPTRFLHGLILSQRSKQACIFVLEVSDIAHALKGFTDIR